MSKLIQKYNIPGPRYTSYPTVPYWDEPNFTSEAWVQTLQQTEKKSISLYIHLPFCESICTFCACNKRITKQHAFETPYINAVLKEWEMYVDILGYQPEIEEIHLGGGTPTFFSPENLERLIEGVFKLATKAENFDFSFEGHPNNTTEDHLQTLYNLGFTRVSYGIQDYNSSVQKAINRMQAIENVVNVTNVARRIGYTSVGHDLIYGLPFQQLEHVVHTIQQTIAIQPDRIAFYSYAHTPWIKGNGQRGFDEADLPSAEEKRLQHETGKRMLEEAGYVEIGMDHFALATDKLYIAMKNNTLHRNFMGYTTTQSKTMIGLGVSSIGDAWNGFAQNEKKLEDYYKRIQDNQLPIFRGHIHDKEEIVIRQHILNLMCQLYTSWEDDAKRLPELKDVLIQLKEMEDDKLVFLTSRSVEILPKGRAFIRNVCMAFDIHLKASKPSTRIFSMTI